MWRDGRCSAILSAIFSEEEYEQDDGDSFSDKPDTITKDTTTKRSVCARPKLSTN